MIFYFKFFSFSNHFFVFKSSFLFFYFEIFRSCFVFSDIFSILFPIFSAQVQGNPYIHSKNSFFQIIDPNKKFNWQTRLPQRRSMKNKINNVLKNKNQTA